MRVDKHNNSFSFIVDNGMPKITINGNNLRVVELVYYWMTATESAQCMSRVTVSGYINDEIKLRVFELNFTTDKVREAIINGGK